MFFAELSFRGDAYVKPPRNFKTTVIPQFSFLTLGHHLLRHISYEKEKNRSIYPLTKTKRNVIFRGLGGSQIQNYDTHESWTNRSIGAENISNS